MITRLLDLSDEFALDRLHLSCTKAFPNMGQILVRAWLDIEDWIDELVPESFGSGDSAVHHICTLPDSVFNKWVYSEFSGIYSLESPDAFTRLLLAAFRHSELSVDFFPGPFDPKRDTKRIVKLFHASDYYAFERDIKSFRRIEWFLTVGCEANEDPSLRIITESQQFMNRLLDAFLEPPDGVGVLRLFPEREDE